MRTADETPGHIVEAAFDKFQVLEGASGISNANQTNEAEFSVFPNPSNAKFTINIDKAIVSNKAYQLKVVDILGKDIKFTLKRINELNQEIDLSGNENGIYFVQLKTHTTIYNKKIIKN